MSLLALSSVSFSIMGAITHATKLPFWELTLARGVVISLLLLPSILKQEIPIAGNNRKWLLIRSLAGTASLVAFFYSLQKISLSEASLLTFSSPVWVAIFAPLVLKEKVYLARVVAIIIGFLGLTFIVGGSIVDLFASTQTLNLGFLAGLCSGIFAGFAYIAVRKLRDDHPLIVVFQFSIASIILSLPGAIFYGRLPVGVEWLAMLGIGSFATLGQYLMTMGYQRVEVSAGSVANLINPLLSQILSVFLFAEAFGMSQLFGGILVISAGVFLPVAEARRKRNLVRATV
jgi:drug/metabolite transporter (DMT)-like permease